MSDKFRTNDSEVLDIRKVPVSELCVEDGETGRADTSITDRKSVV
jgi:hypothetical protein